MISIGNHCFVNYADDATPYVVGNKPEEVTSKLRDIFTCFAPSKTKTNGGKCYMVLSYSKPLNLQISVIHHSQSRKLLGDTSDNNSKFGKHLSSNTPYMEMKKRYATGKGKF